MSSPAPTTPPGAADRADLSALGPALMKGALLVGLGALVLGLIVAAVAGGERWAISMGLAYLTGFAYVLTLSLGAIFFVIIQHLTRAGWSVTLRRVAELMAANIVTVAILGIPVLLGVGVIYGNWVSPSPGDLLVEHKAPWLNVPFFLFRLVLYFAILVAISQWLLRHSLAQDRTGDLAHTQTLQRYSGGVLVAYAVVVTFLSYDLIMTLDSHWFSTIFGVYIFAGSMVGFFAFLILSLRLLRRNGIMARSVHIEHYHDLGKWLFGFVFFWSYIAFSQYMLIWYANIPETTAWFDRRGATTYELQRNAWGILAMLLLFGHCFIPFAGLLSRWAKRRAGLLVFWCGWMLVFHFVDLAWVIMPEARVEVAGAGGMLALVGAALLCTIGLGGLWLGALLKLATGRSLIPTKDPRLGEALAFENI